ncbi:MAG: alpha/beta hydrolase fold-3 [Rhodocyclales bacterium]|nr:alpha/beta hydrolase fold-3 [Rhodocyclales bacterium]
MTNAFVIFLIIAGLATALPVASAADSVPSLPITAQSNASPRVFQATTFVREGRGAVKPQGGRMGANGDILIGWNDKGHWLEWEVDIAATGHYKFGFRYAAGRAWNVYRDLTIDGKSPGPDFEKIVFVPTGGWAKDTNDWSNIVVPDRQGNPALVTLTQGKHTIRMNNLGGGSGDGAFNIDTIAVAPENYDVQTMGRVDARNRALAAPALPLANLVYTDVSPEQRFALQSIQASFPDLAYADKSPLQKLDLYLPASTKNTAPLVIWIHGGGFDIGDKRSMPRRSFGPAPTPTGRSGPYQIQVPDVAALTAKGYAVVSLNYRLGAPPAAAAPLALQDAKAAVRFLRANADKYHLDAKQFAVWGNSAGGYIAAMLGVTGGQVTALDDPSLGNAAVSSEVQAVVVWYGALEGLDSLADGMYNIRGHASTAKNLPPFLIANGDKDSLVSPYQALRLHEALSKAGARSTLVIVPGAGHEDPAFMMTQMLPTFAYLDKVFGR